MGIERKLRRAQAKKEKKKDESIMAEKVALFGKLDTKCLTCEKPFNKMDKEQVITWNVVVRQREEKVNLYCPECWTQAQEIINDLTQRLQNKKEE